MADNKKKQPKIVVKPDPELDTMLARLRMMDDHIRRAFEETARGMGMSTEKLHAWIEDNSHLTPAEQKLLREVTADLNSKVTVTTANPKKLRKSDHEVDKDARNRRSKTLGSRKNWIPMR